MTHHCFLLFIIKSNKHVVVGLYSNRSQRTSKCGWTIGEKPRCSAVCFFSVSRKTYQRCYYPNWSKPVRNLSLALCQNAPKFSFVFHLTIAIMKDWNNKQHKLILIFAFSYRSSKFSTFRHLVSPIERNKRPQALLNLDILWWHRKV